MTVVVEVSIPVGFSRSLRSSLEKALDAFMKEFQSLSGFLARCDSLVPLIRVVPISAVSIPVGFSRSLRYFRSWMESSIAS